LCLQSGLPMRFELHTQLQSLYAGQNGECEVRVELDGKPFVVDVLRDGVVYEVQTHKIRSIRPKLLAFLDDWPVVVVYPVARNTLIIYHEGDPPVEDRRRMSPKHSTALDAFVEATALAKLLQHPNLSLEIPLVSVEEMRVRTPDDAESERRRRLRRRRWRRREWTTVGRRMVELHETVRLDTESDGLELLPESLPESFTSRMLSEAAKLPVHRAQAVAYTLHGAGSLVRTHRTKEGYWYSRHVVSATAPVDHPDPILSPQPKANS
jgi:hypothetical protein